MQRRTQISQSQKLPPKTNKIDRLEQNLFGKLDDIFKQEGVQQHDESFNRLPEKRSTDLLSRAKNIVQSGCYLSQKQLQNPSFFQEGREKLQKEQMKKNQGFMITAVNVVQKKQKPQEVVQNREYPVARDENDMLMDLIEEENKPGDDLAELRRMINQTKRHMTNYAQGLFSLKGNVQNANTNARQIGYGVNDMVFDDMERGFHKYMPDGRTDALFEKKSKPTGMKKSASLATRFKKL